MDKNESGQLSVYVLIMLAWVVFGMLIGGWLFEYSFEYWAGYFKGHAVDLPFWVATIGGVVFSGLTVPAAIITLLCSFVM